MARSLVSFIVSQRDPSDKIPLSGLIRVLDDRLEQGWTLPHPYRIYLDDETRPPELGFPVHRSGTFDELAGKLESWVESASAENDTGTDADALFQIYLDEIATITENAMLSNFLADYHAIFWLGHSIDVAESFGPKRFSRDDDARKFSLYRRWVEGVTRTLSEVAGGLTTILEQEGPRNQAFFESLAKNALIFTVGSTDEEFLGARSYVEGFLDQPFDRVVRTLDDLSDSANRLRREDAGFAWSLGSMGFQTETIDRHTLLDPELRRYLSGHPLVGKETDSSTLDLVCDSILEFEILNLLRRSIIWTSDSTSESGQGHVSSSTQQRLSASTRPLRYDRAGVVDPVIHRFGFVYDLTEFSGTLGEIARSGVRKELISYRQMFLFQKRIDRITTRNRLKFEKFLGDGAFYTTRHASGLVAAALEIQRFYIEMCNRGFVFDRGIRIGLNHGYYRLIPLSNSGSEPLLEFYGPGIVELTRLTTGKAGRRFEGLSAELSDKLETDGDDLEQVRDVFHPAGDSPRGPGAEVDVRDFFVRVDNHRNLVNEGIVAAWSLIEKLESEHIEEQTEISRTVTPHGTYLTWKTRSTPQLRVGLRHLGGVNLKGLGTTEVVEIVDLTDSELELETLAPAPLTSLLRQSSEKRTPGSPERSERKKRFAVCTFNDSEGEVVVMGHLDPLLDSIERPIRIKADRLEGLIGADGPMETTVRKCSRSLRELYRRLSATESEPPFPISVARSMSEFRIYELESELN